MTDNKSQWSQIVPDSSSDGQILTTVQMFNESFRARSNVWDILVGTEAKFPAFFTRVLALSLPINKEIDLGARKEVLVFLINCFQNLENPTVRTECMRLVSLSIWNCVASSARREAEFKATPQLKKFWRHLEKKFTAADENTKNKLIFERSWLSNLLISFVDILDSIPQEGDVPEYAISYCERFLEFLIDLEAQLPTRRYFNTLMDDHNIVASCTLSTAMNRADCVRFKQLLNMLKFYSRFEINDQTGTALTDSEMTDVHAKKLMELQRVAFASFQTSLNSLALANIGAIERRSDLETHFSKLSDEELVRLCETLGLRTQRINKSGENLPREFLLEILISRYEKRTSQIDAVNAMPLYPDENILFDEYLEETENYTGNEVLPLPKLNLQFLTIHDYLLRNFNLFRLESTYEIREDIEDAVKRLAPKLVYPERKTEFTGWARMAIPIESFSIVDIAKPKLGDNKPAKVSADVTFKTGRYTPSIREEWNSLRQHDILFLLTIEATKDSHDKRVDGKSFKTHFGLKYVRGCEVSAIIGEDGKPVDEFVDPEAKKQLLEAKTRTLRVMLDPNQFQLDMDRFSKKKGEDVHETFNVILRRNPKENNFKGILETVRDLMQSELVVPDWLHDIFLGYGDPSSAHYTNMPNAPKSIDFRDTFLDYEHVKESFKDKSIVPAANFVEPVSPPHVIEFPQALPKVKAGTKRKAVEENQEVVEDQNKLVVSTYTLPNMGPYPFNVPKKNQIRFTPSQVEAIKAGTNPGLSLIVGPPGTGKTDVAVQIIANLYHNFPNQRILLVTHSNQALNQLFEKIISLDIDERHLLRLGHGEEELDTDENFGKYGRVNSFLEKRLSLLSEVDRMARSLEISGDHGYTCETAGYFYLYHILSRWEPYIDRMQNLRKSDKALVQTIVEEFPFTMYFTNAPQPVFPESSTFEDALEIAEGCFRHIKNVFTQLEEIRAFELLRSGYDRSNYLLTKEAKIIAMTCTHAALKRRELVSLGFKYDNIVMEEAAQILEVETFIPLLLQESEDGRSRLKRVIMIGDHNQLPPVVQNVGFQQYSNMEQSLFTRFVRLGVPTIDLDAQGRARASIAELFSWKYKKLGNLSVISQKPEYQTANAGFTYDYQLINVDDYEGNGESEPTKYFYQNLGEAEYAVAMFQYMRLLGYPADKITILTTYNGQKALIEDVLRVRCSWNPMFGKPGKVSTVDKYQGQQNDYVILSLVRTKSVGHIKDVRRLIVAMSRARLGFYVLCRKSLFERCEELAEVFSKFQQRPDKLSLEINEKWPSNRAAEEIGKPYQIKDVTHMGAYVHQMTQEQVEHAKNSEKMDETQ